MIKNKYAYIRRQIQEVSDGGLSVLYSKLRKGINLLNPLSILGVLCAIPVVFVIRAIKFFYFIRFGTMTSARIGHFAIDASIMLSERVMTEQLYEDWFWLNTPTCNGQLERMVRRVFYVRWWVRYLYYANKIIPGGRSHEVVKPAGSLDTKGFIERAKHINTSYLPFSAEEDKEAEDFLFRLGWKQGERFVCLMARDSRYLAEVSSRDSFSYHNYRDSDIDTYHAAALELAERGYWVFRMGKYRWHSFCCKHPHVIDYAFNDNRSDLLDVWLMANCYFCISTGTGTDEIAGSYRRPIVYVNFLPFSLFPTWRYCISTPKHLVWKNTGEPLSLKEHLEHNYVSSYKYAEFGINVVDLSSDEIKDAVMEMERQLIGEGTANVRDTELQQKFWDVFKAWPEFSKLHGFIHPDTRMGAAYLSNNPGFLRRNCPTPNDQNIIKSAE